MEHSTFALLFDIVALEVFNKSLGISIIFFYMIVKTDVKEECVCFDLTFDCYNVPYNRYVAFPNEFLISHIKILILPNRFPTSFDVSWVECSKQDQRTHYANYTLKEGII